MLVGVVVPMFNSAPTISETLDSILAQSHRELDVLVVDDGSSDNGSAIVEHLAGRDSRLRLLRQPNGGVAAARNAGARAATGDMLAFCDADDLWAPRKIELQLAAMAARGADCQFAYSWFAIIDAQSRISSLEHQPTAEGAVLEQLCRHNFVGNGSAMLITRALFEAIGGFDQEFQQEGVQGSEDYDFCFRAAERTHFAVAKAFLVGYRVFEGTMSGDLLRMQRSLERTYVKAAERHPELKGEMDSGLASLTLWLMRRALHSRNLSQFQALYRRLPPHGRPSLMQFLPALANGLALRGHAATVNPFSDRPNFLDFCADASVAA